MSAITPKQARAERQRRTRATRIALQRRWPDIFAAPKKPKRPLARGIDKQIARAAPDLSRGDIRLALQDYTGGPSYLRACVVGAARIGLDGEPAGFVAVGEAEHAARRALSIERQRARSVQQPTNEAHT